jgi:flagellar basal-body rod protein FlgG
MIKALTTAASGMQAQEAKLNQIANDLANMNTNAFKRGRTDFQDLIYQNVKEAGGEAGTNQTPVGIQVGSGARVSAQYSVHEQGAVKTTGGQLDMMVNGEGFFAVQRANGSVAYTRDGAFHTDKDGKVITSNGMQLVPPITIPPGVRAVTIASNGEVRVTTGDGQESKIGDIQLTTFINPGALRQAGQNLVEITSAAGPPVTGVPGEGGTGYVQQGAIETSNVKPTEAIMDMITTQRVYESNARIMNVGDQMWSATNNIGSR